MSKIFHAARPLLADSRQGRGPCVSSDRTVSLPLRRVLPIVLGGVTADRRCGEAESLAASVGVVVHPAEVEIPMGGRPSARQASLSPGEEPCGTLRLWVGTNGVSSVEQPFVSERDWKCTERDNAGNRSAGAGQDATVPATTGRRNPVTEGQGNRWRRQTESRVWLSRGWCRQVTAGVGWSGRCRMPRCQCRGGAPP